MAEDNVRYSFKVEWFDTVASLLRPYELYYFPHDKTLEMVRLHSTTLPHCRNGMLALHRCLPLVFAL